VLVVGLISKREETKQSTAKHAWLSSGESGECCRNMASHELITMLWTPGRKVDVESANAKAQAREFQDGVSIMII
jgi:hypothetical protein